jgi:hypothetical protein
VAAKKSISKHKLANAAANAADGSTNPPRQSQKPVEKQGSGK